MKKSEQIDQLAAALAAAQAELDPASKDARNSHLGNRYADLAACWDALKVVLPKHGLSVSQVGRAGLDSEPATLETILIHKSGQWVEGEIPLLIGESKGLNAMQALGSAWTYARRYGLAAICGLTAEDDDAASIAPKPIQKKSPSDVMIVPANVAADIVSSVLRPAAPTPAPKPTPAPTPPAKAEGQHPDSKTETLLLKKVVTKTGKSNGKEWTRTSVLGERDDGSEIWLATFDRGIAEAVMQYKDIICKVVYMESEKGCNIIAINDSDPEPIESGAKSEPEEGLPF